MKLHYKAVTRDGKAMRGIIEAKTIGEAGSYLRTKGLLPIHIEEQSNKSLGSFLPFFNKVKPSEVAFFTRQLSSMLESGLTLMQSFSILKEQIQSEKMREVVSGIIIDVEEGKSFGQAISKYPDIFSSIYISLIRAGEASGLLDKVLSRLAENLEKDQKLKSTVKSALLYPIIVIIGMVAVMMVLMIFVIPQLSSLYEGLNIDLPLPTRIVIGISNFLILFWPLVIGFFIILLFGFRRWHKTESGRLILDNVILKLPIFGKLIKEKILTEFSRTFGLLVGSGTLVVDALHQAAEVGGNIHYKNAIIGVSKRVEKGIGIGDALGAYPLFPPILVQMASIGEQTGKLDESLLRVSEYFDHEVEIKVKNLTTAMEPFIMVVLGIGVAFLVISIITPIYSLINNF